MKQASKKSNQQQAPKSNDTPIGAMSITAILKELSKSSNKSIAATIQKTFNPLAIRFYSVSITNQNTLLKLIETHTISVDTHLQNITQSLINYLQNSGKNSAQPASASVVKFLKGDDYAQSILIEIVGLMQTIIAMQESLMTMLSKIYTYLPQLSTASNQKTIKSFNQSTKEYIEFLDTLGKLNKVVSKDFVERFTKLTDQYVRFVDKKNTSALIVVGVQLTRFTKVLGILGIVLKKTRKIFRSLTMTLIMLALAVTLPPFSIAMVTLFAITYKLQATFNPRFAFGFTKSINSIRNALVAMVLAMFLMSKVSVQDFYKVIGCLVVMAGVIKLLTKAQGGKGGVGKITNKKLGDNSGNTTISGLGGLAFGLAAIILALNYVKTVNWSAVTVLLIFLTAMIGLMILASKMGVSWGPAIFNKRTQKTGQSLFDGLFKLALGLAILLLCADAANEVQWAGAAMILAFIAGIGLVLWATAKVTKQSRFGGPFQGIFGFAMGVAILLLCADAVKEIDWLTAGKLIFFIAAISFAIHAPEMIMSMKGKRFGGRGGKMSGMFGFAAGLALIILALAATKELNMVKAFQVIAFMAAMVFITNKAKGTKNVKQLKGSFGMLLAIFTATVFVIALASRIIKPGPAIVAVALTLGVIYLLGDTIRHSYDKLNRVTKLKKVAEEMAYFAALGVMTVSVLSYINNPIAAMINAVIMFAVLFGIVKLIQFTNKKKKEILSVQKILWPFAGFLAITIAAVTLISMIPVNITAVLTYVLAVAAVIAITWLAGKFDKEVKKGSISLILIGVSMLITAFALKKIMSIQFNLEAALTFVGTIIVMAGICAILGIPAVAVLVGLGAVVLLGLSIVLFISAVIISIVTQMTFNVENISNFSESVGLIAKAFGENLGWIILGVIGAALFLVIAVTTIITAVSLMLISLMPCNNENVNNFGKAIKTLANAYGENIVWITLGAVAAVLFVVIAVTTIVSCVALMLISVIPINTEKIKTFGNGMVSLIDAYNELGFFSTMKAVGKALMLVPIAASSLLVALALKAIAMLDIDKSKIEKFGEIVDLFISTMCDIVDKNRKKIEANKEAFKVIADMANAAGSILNVVEQMANMTVAVWGTDKQTGELKIISRRQINENDFELVSQNMGKVMKALIAPLTIIASNDEWWDFGDGVKIKNPFGKVNGFFGPKDDMSGVNRIKAIGDAFEKIPAIMQGFCNNPLLTDVTEEGEKKMERLQKNIGIFFDTIIQVMDKLPKKSVLDTWFDGTASWLENTVSPVFTSSTTIVKNLSPQVTLMWQYSKLPLILSNIELFWSTTKDIAQHVNVAKILKIDKTFATKAIEFYNEMNKLSTNSWLSANNGETVSNIAIQTKNLIDNLANTKSFSNINKNLSNTDKNIKNIVGNINKISLPKAQILEKNLRLLTQAKSQEALKEAIESLKEMIGLLKEVQERQTQATQQQTEQAAQQFDVEQQEKENSRLSEDEKQTKLLTVLQNLESLMQGNGIHASVNLTGINEEIEQALYNCGLATGDKFSKTGLTVKW